MLKVWFHFIRTRFSAKAFRFSSSLPLLPLSFVLFGFTNCGSNLAVSPEISGTSYCATVPNDPACTTATETVCRFDGMVVPEGASVLAYQNSTPAVGSPCVSQTRTCTNGALSGVYNYSSCSANLSAACVFNGQTIASGSSVVAYLASSVAAGSTCQGQSRSCVNGVLSGSYGYASCSVAASASCLFNGQTIAHGDSVVAYPDSSVAAGSTCQPQTRTCFNGTLSGSGSYASCQIAAPRACTFNGQTLASGQSVVAYASSNVAAGQTCDAVTRVCQDGTLTNAGDFASCAVAAPASCVLDGQTIPDGGTVTRYLQSEVPYGQTCGTEIRACSNGVLSGSATITSCVAHTAPLLSSLVTSAGVDVLIPAGQKYEIDNAAAIGLLQVQGQLVCPAAGNFTLNVQGLQVYGTGALFQCGTSAAPFAGSLNIRLNGGRQVMGAERSFVAFTGGTIQLAGQRRNVNWFRLATTAETGAQVITMTGGEGWAPGDHIAIAPTNFDPHEAEEAVITAVADGGKTLTLAAPLKYRHWGGVQNIAAPSRTWAVDESAEVINLTRNIRIEAPGDGPSLDYQGGHIMIMSSAFGYADAIELTHMGQMGHMARYPFHWHRAGDVTGQFIVNSSIHDSFQRCITVHGSNNALVQNNVCYDHFGHGYFLEDGNETGNQFLNNVGILTKKPPVGRQLLQSDLDVSQLPRWAGPSTFWISNPANTFVGNVAAGSEGSGFWGSFVDQVKCDTTACVVVTDGTGNVFPSKTALARFDQNVAHSMLVGMTWDGGDQADLTGNPNNPNDRYLTNVHYTPPTRPTVNQNVVTKNTMNGLYFRGQPFTFNETILADNNNGAWLAYNQTIQSSAIIATTANHRTSDYAQISQYGGDITFRSGVWIYDGPLELTNVDFINFSTTQSFYNGIDVSSVPFRSVGGANRSSNRVQGLTFTPEPWHRFLFKPDNWLDTPYTMSIRDVDGSLTGTANDILVIDNAYNAHSSCVSFPGTRAMKCAYQPSSLYVARGNYMPFSFTRSDGAKSRNLVDLPDTPTTLYNKIGLVAGGTYDYTMRLGIDIVGTPLIFLYQAETIGTLSPVIRIADVGTGCTISNATAVGSVALVRSTTASSAYYQSGQDIYMKLRTKVWDTYSPNRAADGGFIMSCTGHPAIDQLASWKVFDPDFYRATYPDVASFSDVNARNHWVQHGLPEGRYAALTYIPDEYLAVHADVRAAVSGSRTEAARHYITTGYAEGRPGRAYASSLVYVQAEYQALNADLALMSDDEARNHWIKYGAGEGRQGANNFSSQVYLSRYADVAAAVGSSNFGGAVDHYVVSGYAEGRSGHP